MPNSLEKIHSSTNSKDRQTKLEMMNKVKKNFKETSELLAKNVRNEINDPVNAAINKLKESQENIAALE